MLVAVIQTRPFCSLSQEMFLILLNNECNSIYNITMIVSKQYYYLCWKLDCEPHYNTIELVFCVFPSLSKAFKHKLYDFMGCILQLGCTTAEPKSICSCHTNELVKQISFYLLVCQMCQFVSIETIAWSLKVSANKRLNRALVSHVTTGPV